MGADEIDRGPRTKRAVVFLHGFLGSARDWQEVIQGWRSPTRLLALNLPGHGARPEAVPTGSGAFVAAARDLRERAAALGVSEVDLVGYSMGGRLALAWLLDPLARVRRAVLIGASAGIAQEAARLERRERDEALSRALMQDGLRPFLDRWYAQPLFAPLARHPEFPALLARRAQQSPHGAAQALARLGPGNQPPLGQPLAASKTPALLVAGALDANYVAQNAALARCRDGIRAETIPDAGHCPHLETPDALRQVLEGFLSEEG